MPHDSIDGMLQKLIQKTNVTPILLVGLFLIIQVSIIIQSSDFLIANILPDDAFYYFKIASNLASNMGSTFDGVNMTNGYHPLWMGVNYLAFYFFGYWPGYFAPIKFLLFISVFLNLFSAWFIYLVIDRFTNGNKLGIMLLFLVLFNPFFIVETINGLETSLSLFFVSIFVWSWLKYKDEESIKYLLFSSLALSGAFLSRIDNIFYLLVFVSWGLFYELRKRVNYRKIFLIVLPAIVFLCWVSLNYYNFGILLTSASNTSTEVVRGLVYQDNGGGILVFLKTIVYMIDLQIRNLGTFIGVPLIWVLLFGFLLGGIRFSDHNVKIGRLLVNPIILVTVSFLVMFLVNSGWRWVARSWYFVMIGPICAFLVALLFYCTKREEVNKYDLFTKYFFIIILIFSIYNYSLIWHRQIIGRYNSQTTMIEASKWINENIPSDQVIGAFNAGVQGYFSSRKIVNLDGLVNMEASEAIFNNNLGSYILDNVDYLSDFPVYWEYRYRSFMGEVDLYEHMKKEIEISDGHKLYGLDSGIIISKLD